MPEKKTTAIKAIRQFCRECVCEDMDWIRNCPSVRCALYPFRLGKNPNISEGSRAKSREQALIRNFGQKVKATLTAEGE